MSAVVDRVVYLMQELEAFQETNVQQTTPGERLIAASVMALSEELARARGTFA